MTGTDLNTLYVHIGRARKIATITIPVGSETELTLTYEPDWVKEGFPISPHLPISGKFDHRSVRNVL